MPQLDSLLGATVQRTRYLNTTKRILTDEAGVPTPDADIKVISGLDLLTNNQVSESDSACEDSGVIDLSC